MRIIEVNPGAQPPRHGGNDLGPQSGALGTRGLIAQPRPVVFHGQQGATVPALQDATGWQPHSVRAALTGLRKKGIDIARDKNGKGETIYRAGA
mgnify:CR=1 FL=1